MASNAQKDHATRIVVEFLSGKGKGRYWPRLHEEDVATGLMLRISDPDWIHQRDSNLCGMATVVHDLIESDPVMYAWVGTHLFKYGRARLGRGKTSVVIVPSVETRHSPVPASMDHADWLVLASLRDHSNKVMKFAYNAKIPVLADIPLLGILGRTPLSESIAAINWPGDLESLLRAAGFKNVKNRANTTSLAGYENLQTAGELHEQGYQVMLLISNSMLAGGGPTITAQHWVTLESRIDENMNAFPGTTDSRGVAFTIFNSLAAEKQRVPKLPAKYVVMRRVLDNYYGYVAAYW